MGEWLGWLIQGGRQPDALMLMDRSCLFRFVKSLTPGLVADCHGLQSEVQAARSQLAPSWQHLCGSRIRALSANDVFWLLLLLFLWRKIKLIQTLSP